MKVLRVIHHGGLHPSQNMALDEALLRSPGTPTLRLYGWSPPGLSLGYFQEARAFQEAGSLEAPSDHVVVRRITGGGAICHTDEITFALTADADLLPRSVPASYELLNGAVAAALETIGVTTVTACSDQAVHRGGRSTDPWCFQDPCGADLMTASGGKILGSAQRRIRQPRSRILHQASLVMRPPAPTPSCGSVSQHREPEPVRQELADALVREVAQALGLHPEAGEVLDDETALARVLVRERYGNLKFTLRR